jgi:uncharacterized protein (TIGR02058 family)
MPLTRCLIEIGSGVDLHGSDSTKAAARAVADAFARNNVSVYTLATMFHADIATLQIEATIGVPNPGTVDREVVTAQFPRGEVILHVKQGGAHVPDDVGPDATIVASAVLVIRLDILSRCAGADSHTDPHKNRTG